MSEHEFNNRKEETEGRINELEHRAIQFTQNTESGRTPRRGSSGSCETLMKKSNCECPTLGCQSRMVQGLCSGAGHIQMIETR